MRNERISIGKIIADNIRAERNRANLTQEVVASKVDVTPRTYISYEQNAKSVEAPMLLFLSKIFGCNVNDFYLNINFTVCETDAQNKKEEE